MSWSGATRAYVEPLLSAARVAPGVRLLDVACGPGYVAGAAAELGADAVGLDVAEEMVARAAQRYAGVEFVVGDAHGLGFRDAAFDSVTTFAISSNDCGFRDVIANTTAICSWLIERGSSG